MLVTGTKTVEFVLTIIALPIILLALALTAVRSDAVPDVNTCMMNADAESYPCRWWFGSNRESESPPPLLFKQPEW